MQKTIFSAGALRFATQDSALLNGQRNILARLLKKSLGGKNDFLSNRDHLEVGFRWILMDFGENLRSGARF